jgi:hypothetical protein
MADNPQQVIYDRQQVLQLASQELPSARMLIDGLFDVTDVDYALVDFDRADEEYTTPQLEAAERIVKENPDTWCSAHAYGLDSLAFLSRAPRRLPLNALNGYLNQGALAVINIDRPMKLLIVAEDD